MPPRCGEPRDCEKNGARSVKPQHLVLFGFEPAGDMFRWALSCLPYLAQTLQGTTSAGIRYGSCFSLFTSRAVAGHCAWAPCHLRTDRNAVLCFLRMPRGMLAVSTASLTVEETIAPVDGGKSRSSTGVFFQTWHGVPALRTGFASGLRVRKAQAARVALARADALGSRCAYVHLLFFIERRQG